MAVEVGFWEGGKGEKGGVEEGSGGGGGEMSTKN